MNLQTYVAWLTGFLDTVVIFLIALAFLFFVFNAIKFFVVQSPTEDGRAKAKSLALYSLLAFVLLIIFWGIVNLLSNSFGFTEISKTTIPCSDYIDDCDNNPINRNSGGLGDDVGTGFGLSGVDPRPTGSGGPEGIPTGSGVSTGGSDPSPRRSDPDRPSTPQELSGAEAEFYAEALIRAEAMEEARQAAIRAANLAITTLDKVAAAQRAYSDEIVSGYDERTGIVVQNSISAISDSTARPESKGTAAALLLLNNVITEDQFQNYSNLVGFDADSALQNASDYSDTEFQSVLNNTSESLYNALLFSNQRLLRSSATEAQMTETEVNQIMSEPAGADRIAMFNMIIGDKPHFQTISQQQTVQDLRLRLLNDGNVERFYNGQPPIAF